MDAMRVETGLRSTSAARAWRSCAIQVLYSVWRIRLFATGRTAPWQAAAAHDPGPVKAPAAGACADRTVAGVAVGVTDSRARNECVSAPVNTAAQPMTAQVDR